MSKADKKNADNNQIESKCTHCNKTFFCDKSVGLPRRKCYPFCKEYKEVLREKRAFHYQRRKLGNSPVVPVNKTALPADKTPFHFKVLFAFDTAILLVLLFIAYRSHGECTSYEFNYNLLKEVTSECC